MENFILLFELIALLSCLYNFKQLKSSPMKWFLLLLVVTNLVEWGNHFDLFIINKSTNWISNIRNPFEFLFISWFYTKIIENPSLQKRIKVIAAFIFLASVLNFLFFQGYRYLNSYTIILGGCSCIYFIVLYFREVIEKAAIPNLYKHPYFWISVGFLFFYMGQSILLSFFQYFLFTNQFKAFLPIWTIFIYLIIFILYTCLSIAFFCRIKPPAISSQV
jgi:hypothetical protein